MPGEHECRCEETRKSIEAEVAFSEKGNRLNEDTFKIFLKLSIISLVISIILSFIYEYQNQFQFNLNDTRIGAIIVFFGISFAFLAWCAKIAWDLYKESLQRLNSIISLYERKES